MKMNDLHSPAAAVFTELVLEIFRLNGKLLLAGDQLVKPKGMTSARWQVLGAIEIVGHPLSVAQIARRMGLSRQAVQRVANDLQKLGFVTFEDNPDHKRAKLITLSAQGLATLGVIGDLQARWANALAQDMDPARLADAVEILRDLQKRCETTDIDQVTKQNVKG